MGFSNKQLILICASMLLLTFVFGLTKSHEMGYYKAAINYCEPLSPGYDKLNQKYVCYNESNNNNMQKDYSYFLEGYNGS